MRLLPALVLLCVACTGCPAPGDSRPAPASKAAAPSSTAPDEVPSPDSGPDVPLRKESVRLYFPSASSDGLVEEAREILRTTTPGDRAKQILSDLIGGPSNDAAVSFIPTGTRVRQVFVVSRTAYADFSEELRSGIEGGSDAELLTVYSIVNSLGMNIEEIDRVAILVEGRPCETLNGHLDLRRPLKPDQKLIFDVHPDPETGA